MGAPPQEHRVYRVTAVGRRHKTALTVEQLIRIPVNSRALGRQRRRGLAPPRCWAVPVPAVGPRIMVELRGQAPARREACRFGASPLPPAPRRAKHDICVRINRNAYQASAGVRPERLDGADGRWASGDGGRPRLWAGSDKAVKSGTWDGAPGRQPTYARTG